ncbi:polyphosphate kinase 2 [Streptomyces sp. WI04-05B]|uniref:polyphosphate kinase 2 n=1 Tax=Streptomyces TaxID=1883 RepID=UPI0029A71328|nr:MULTISPECIES: polyphosphate kinase 2 [unclassified Streptomyces]MDX2545113.1 polyphosphate kinase 2 [Streptomyces sp. WI04-05B]MDX2587604.1 polyphosphate kinase 2 [Streptomyces sp. WI04-05A]MDX3748216.1 polyphosphate kinase 2 [Streptomyces sp. AK08-02]
MAGKKAATLPRKVYEPELLRLQTELVKLQEWIRAEGARPVIVFEGRDAAGKGGTIKRVAEHLNPRVARIAALPKPTERQRTQWYFQRYVEQLPAAGEIVLFDRSWYNRAGIVLRKYWFSVSDAVQQERFRQRLKDPLRMLVHTDISEAPWYVVESDDKRRARLNMIAHLLSTVPYHEVPPPVLELPHRPPSTGYERPPRDLQTYVPDHAAGL